jgi:hypothetical protein
MDIKFLRGLLASLPATRDDKTFYYTTDSHQLWLGDYLLSNEVTAAAFASLEARVKSLEDADFQAQIDGIKETLKSIATSDTVEAIDERVSALETWKNGLPAYVTESVYNTHLTTQSEKDAAQDKALTDYKAEMVTALAGKETAGAAAQALTDAKGYTDDKIDDLIKTYLDGETDDVINTLEEVAAWINNDTAGVTKIIEDVATNAAGVKQNKEDLDKVEAKLNGIADGDGTVKAAIDAALAEAKRYADDNDANTVYDDTALSNRVGVLEGKVDVEKVSTAISTATADMATNSSVDTKLADYTKTADLGELATKDVADLNLGQYMTTEAHNTFVSNNSALQSGITAAKVGEYDAVKSTVDTNKAIWDNAATAVQPAAIADMATKTHVADNYVAKEGYVAFTSDEKAKLAGLENYNDSAVTGRLDVIEAKPAMNITADQITAWDNEVGAKKLAGEKATLAEVKDAYIGDTNAKLIDVVKAVNMLAEGSEATDKVVETVATNVKDIEARLTWGTF